MFYLQFSCTRNHWQEDGENGSVLHNAEIVLDAVTKTRKLLHLGFPQLQKITFGLSGTGIGSEPVTRNDVFVHTLIDDLDIHFPSSQNSCFVIVNKSLSYRLHFLVKISSHVNFVLDITCIYLLNTDLQVPILFLA